MKQSRRRRRAQSKNKAEAAASRNSNVNDGDFHSNCILKGNGEGKSEEQRIINGLVEAFSLSSVEDAEAADREVNGDLNKAADILTELAESSEAYQASCSSSSSNQCCNLDSSSEGCADSSGGSEDVAVVVNSRRFKGNRGKKVVAVAGTVSNLLGKEYVSSSPRKELMTEKGGVGGGGKVDVVEAEQFLCSMLGDDCELSMGVVRDVLCNCGYSVEKALEVLLDLSGTSSGSDKFSSSSASSSEHPGNKYCDDIFFWELSDKGCDSYSHSSESDIQDGIQLHDYTGRNYAEALMSSGSSRKLASASTKPDEDELPQLVLESLFNIPKRTEHDPSTMNWKNVAKQMESFAQRRVELGPYGFPGQQMSTQAVAKGAEYHAFRDTARQQWDKVKNCYHKAANAYSNGEKNYASYMSQQANLYSRRAQHADDKASMEIFKARNKGIENSLTIDLHGQHVKPAMSLVKLHILFATYISSVQYIRIITGCGSRGLGKSILKQSVIDLLKNEGIEWREENQGTVIIKLNGAREFSFLHSDGVWDSQ